MLPSIRLTAHNTESNADISRACMASSNTECRNVDGSGAQLALGLCTSTDYAHAALVQSTEYCEIGRIVNTARVRAMLARVPCDGSASSSTLAHV